MTRRLAFLFLAGLAGCNPSSPWNKFEDMPSPHLNIEHMVRVDEVGFASVNGRYVDREELFNLFSNVAKNQKLAYIFVVVGEGASERQWAEVKRQIENSGACASNFCIDGYEEDPLPAERLKAN